MGGEMKKLLLLLSVLLLFGCATTGYHTVKFSSLTLGDINLVLPSEVPDFTKGRQLAAVHITKKYCALVFPEEVTVYKLVVNCEKPKVYALIVTTLDKVECWIYLKGFPVAASLGQIQTLLKGLETSGNTITGTYKGMVQGT